MYWTGGGENGDRKHVIGDWQDASGMAEHSIDYTMAWICHEDIYSSFVGITRTFTEGS